MDFLKSFILSFFILSSLISCDSTVPLIEQDESETTVDTADCEFVKDDDSEDGLIDETERSIMRTCDEGSLTTRADIENHIIGDWVLIGHGEGWFPNVPQPCSSLSISKEELTLQYTDSYADTLLTVPWELTETDWGGETRYELTVRSDKAQYISINQYCESYMYGDATPVDGNMYLYEKKK